MISSFSDHFVERRPNFLANVNNLHDDENTNVRIDENSPNSEKDRMSDIPPSPTLFLEAEIPTTYLESITNEHMDHNEGQENVNPHVNSNVLKTNKIKLQPKKSLQAAMISPHKALIPKRKTQSPHFSPETGQGIKVILARKGPNGKSYTRQNERQSKASKRVQLKSK